MMRIHARCLYIFPRHVGQTLLTAGASIRALPKICPIRLPRHVRPYQTAEASSNPLISPKPFEFEATSAGAKEDIAAPFPTPLVESENVLGREHPDRPPLPVSCPGCGALSQEVTSDEAGYYTRSRKAVKSYLRSLKDADDTSAPLLESRDAISTDSPKPGNNGSRVTLAEYEQRVTQRPQAKLQETPVCDRCHDLIYNSRGASVAHPTIEAIADSIAESPFRRNHVYHVIDAADFPLSLIPSIFTSLSLAKPRSQNRRSQHDFSRKPTLSFIITRSDLLAPTKDTVDCLMPYFTSVLRQALGHRARDIRLGNVHLVSAKRGWWTTGLKDSIWARGGGNWLVGKVNVGKSNLFEVLFPKGSGARAPSYAELEQETESDQFADSQTRITAETYTSLSETSLLPPPQPETAFPVLPLVSSLPGTTASPIRLPFGRHKGELIDLPGLARGNLEDFVQPEHKPSLVMTHRPTVTQHIIKPGQSLLLGGGLIRITPLFEKSDPSTTLLAYPFVPLQAHVTSTDKAIGAQMQQRQSNIKTILAEGAGEKMRLAGIYKLDTDVTRARARSLIQAGVALEKLPFRVYSADIIIEGVGWVELVCQVRRTREPLPESLPSPFSVMDSTGFVSLTSDASAGTIGEHNFGNLSSYEAPGDALNELQAASEDASARRRHKIPGLEGSIFEKPRVEVHTPSGAHVGKRTSMSAWVLLESGRRRKAKKAAAGGRPRKPMKGAKKRAKAERRAKEAAVLSASGND